MAIMSLSILVPTDVDFVARFPSNRRIFQWKSSRIKNCFEWKHYWRAQTPQRRRLQKRRK